jgi:hypothetical protein
VLQLAAADDVMAEHMSFPVESIVWVPRVGFRVFPVTAFIVTRYACPGLQGSDMRAIEYCLPTGLVADQMN